MMKDYQRLLKNLVGIGFIAGLVFVVYMLFFTGEKDQLMIDETPIHIESIRTIAEIATVSYKDEIVVDSVEFYKGETDYLDPFEWSELIDRTFNRNVKRRLTLIFKGEVIFGLDLSEKNYSATQNEDTLWLRLPQPKILDVVISPKATEVFEEQGVWGDGARKSLEEKAKLKLRNNAIHLNLDKKALDNATKLIRKLVISEKIVIIEFE